MQKRSFSFFLRTSTTGEAQGLQDSRMTPTSSNCFRWSWTSRSIDGGIRRWRCLNGLSSLSLMLCFTVSVWPMSKSPSEKMSLYSSSNSFKMPISSSLKLVFVRFAKNAPSADACSSDATASSISTWCNSQRVSCGSMRNAIKETEYYLLLNNKH